MGNLTLTDILEVVALDELPGDAGPLTFVAFLRGAEPGPAKCAFVVHPAGQPTPEIARLPLDVQVSDAMDNRQVAVQVHLPSIPVKQGGWFDVTFEWEGVPLAQNRFAIGALSQTPDDASPEQN